MRGPGHEFVGRRRHLQELSDAFTRAVNEQPCVVLVHGPGGSGKTRLVTEALHAAAARTVSARAEPSESGTDFSLARKLLAAAGAPPTAVSDVVEIGSALLEVTASGGAGSVTAVFADDLQCADPASLAVLAFVARRLVAERAVLLGAVRAPAAPAPRGYLGAIVRAAQPPHGRVLEVSGLEHDEVAVLVRAVMGRDLQPHALAHLVELTQGNPLWVSAALRETTRESLHAGVELPVPQSLHEDFARRWATTGPAARELLAALAVLTPPRRVWELARVCADDVGTTVQGAVAEAVSAGLLLAAAGDDPVDFTHPSVAGEVGATYPPALLRALHLRAAGHEPDPARSLRHRLLGTDPPNAELAAEAALTAHERARDSAPLEAAELLELAARHSPDQATAEARRLEGAHVCLASGYRSAARSLLSIEPHTLSSQRDYLTAWVAWVDNDLPRAVEHAQAAWAGGGSGAVGGAWLLGTMRMFDGDGAAALEWARRARLRHNADHPVESHLITAMLASSLAVRGRCRQALSVLGPEVTHPGPVDLLPEAVRGYLLLWAGDHAGAQLVLSRCATAAARLGHYALAQVPQSYLSELEHRRGNWDQAEVWAARMVASTDAFDEAWAASPTEAIASSIPARRGDFERARKHVEVALAASRASGSTARVFALVAQVQLAHAEGDWPSVRLAADQLTAREHRDGLDAPGAVIWRALAAEEAARRDDRSALRAHRRVLLDQPSPAPATQVGLARVTAMLAACEGRPALATQAFAESADRAQEAGLVFEEAMAHLLHGEHLIRAGQGGQGQLAAAARIFERLAAAPYVNRARRRSGPAEGGDPPPSPWTSQEQVIARMVAHGRTNREIAGELVLSPRTVEYHVSNALRKVGLRSRTQLARYVLTSDDPDPVGGARDAPPTRR
ncbi:AAA family ATPase [Phycicoccus avicenniae]|uniref:helix-turn-helix transcriptional regulator n=1 Tax=Phycicoccus avicenniae TaxID=2828860 RepID=UPI003D2D5F9B